MNPFTCLGTHPFERKVEHFVRKHDLLKPDDKIAVAVSGGPDSVALLACLVSLRSYWRWDLSIIHVDHGIRGEESRADAEFVRGLGRTWGVPTRVRCLNLTKREARTAKQSLQEIARNIRYAALHQESNDLGATKIALGHQADDQAETVLMWMVRGSGTGGLGGISPRLGSMVVRPILERTRPEILKYLEDKHLTFRLDSTNVQPVYFRNRVRREMIPLLKEYSPGIVKVLSRQAQLLRDDHAYLEQVAQTAFEDYCRSEGPGTLRVSRSALLALPLPIRRRVVRKGLQLLLAKSQGPRFDLVQTILDQVTQGQSGWVVECHGIRASQEYDGVVIRRSESGSDVFPSLGQEMTLTIPGTALWPLTGQKVQLSEVYDIQEDHSLSILESGFDRETFSLPLRLRVWKPGDVFCPRGLGGKRKKLQDFFSDIKLPRSRRHLVPLLVAPEGILCVGDLRTDERFQATSSTKSLVYAQISGVKY